jgi:hypothetical protein
MDTAIKAQWAAVKEKQHLLKNWKYFGARDHHLNSYLKLTRSAIEKLILAMDTIENVVTLEYINDQISEYQARKISKTFRNVIDITFKKIADELFNTMVNRLNTALDNPLRKLNIWMNANTMSLEQPDQLYTSIQIFDEEISNYFALMNPSIINYWFLNHQSRVPHDWEARLMGFNNNDRFLVTAIKAKLPNITDFSEFFDILDYTVRTSFEMANDP